MISKVYIVVRGWRDAYYDWVEVILAAYVTKEQADQHADLATREIKEASRRCARWTSDKRWEAYRSPYDPGLRTKNIAADRPHSGLWPVLYEVREAPMVAHVDQFMENLTEEAV